MKKSCKKLLTKENKTFSIMSNKWKKSRFYHDLVLGKPSIITSASNETIEGEDVSLLCVNPSVHNGTITWFKDGESFANGGQSLLDIKNIQRTDSGNYKCMFVFNGLVAESEDFVIDISCKLVQLWIIQLLSLLSNYDQCYQFWSLLSNYDQCFKIMINIIKLWSILSNCDQSYQIMIFAIK